MTAFAKKVAKAVKRPDTCIIIGNAFGHLDEIVETFNTVFILSSGDRVVKGKNVVYRESFDDITALPPVTAIFFNKETLEQINLVEKVIEKNRAMVFVEGDSQISENQHLYMKKKKYKLTETFKDHQRWERTK